jgi:tryptophan synthase beta chain
VSRSILFNLSGHGHFDISAYEKFFEGNLPDHEVSADEIEKSISQLNLPVPTL